MTETTHAPLTTLFPAALTIRQRPAPAAVTVSTPDTRLPLQERASILESAVSEALATGAQLESHTATVAVVTYQGSPLNHATRLLVTMMRLGLGLFARAAAEHVKSSRVMLTVDECGNLTRWALPR